MAPDPDDHLKHRLAPWIVAVAGMLVLMVSNGMVISGITAFDESLIGEFGWSRGELKFRDLITLVGTGLVAPFIGVLIDRFGVRMLLIAGSLMLSAGYLGYAEVRSIGDVYLIHALFAAVLVASGMNVAVIMVSNWFVQHRGTAIGLVVLGTSLGGVLFPPAISLLIGAYGWRGSFQLMALVPLLLLTIGVFLARSPRELGSQPLGADSIAGDARPHGHADDLTLAQALRTRSFWALAAVAGLSFYCMLGVISSLRLHLQDLGADSLSASQSFAWMMSMALAGKFLFGFLADRFNQALVFVGNLLIMLLGVLTLASMNADFSLAAITLLGLGWGGLFTLIQIQAVNNFGLTHAGKILGLITLIDASCGGLGAWLSNVLYAGRQSYQFSFQIMVGLMLLALLAALAVRKTRPMSLHTL
jgi:predicted MFS family arabinose efflux permease